ncbi:MAG: NAD(P)H-binding protein [Pseudomonadota bacterium]
MAGATGTIGRATAAALVARGHDVAALVRPPRKGGRRAQTKLAAGVSIRSGDVTDPTSLIRDGFNGERFDVVVSCLASRTGAPDDAWAIDHDAHVQLLDVARDHGVRRFILLSALCVQRPMLAFQHAKLAFEAKLMESALDHAIVRPTAYFKSLAGQLDRVRAGKPYLLFGDGRLTACKPISDRDLGDYLARCVDTPALRNRILPIGGPGPAITPRDQADHLFAKLGLPPRYKHVPLAMMDAIVAGLGGFSRVVPSLRAKAELARIGRYYASQSMLVWDEARGRYDAQATPVHGNDTLFAYYDELIARGASVDRGDHAVF